jgi:hypothetical protein
VELLDLGRVLVLRHFDTRRSFRIQPALVFQLTRWRAKIVWREGSYSDYQMPIPSDSSFSTTRFRGDLEGQPVGGGFWCDQRFSHQLHPCRRIQRLS